VESALKPVVERYKGKVSHMYFRADADFANPEVYEFLEAERIKYSIRLPANRVLQERIGHLLTRPVGRPSKRSAAFLCKFHLSSWKLGEGASGANAVRLQLYALAYNLGYDGGPDQGLIAEGPEREAHQNWREGRQPWPLRRIPDGRGHHPPKSVCRHPAADRGTSAASRAVRWL
jgi:hypothetical protein